jgi:hypothetical protein
MGGQVPVAFDTLDTLLPQFESGKLRVLATSGAKRVPPGVPAVPTFKRSRSERSCRQRLEYLLRTSHHAQAEKRRAARHGDP